MHPAIPHLIELQRVDHQIAVLRAELEAFPKRIRDAETKLGGARADVASAKEAHTQIITERKKFEFDAQQWKDRARKYRDQSGAVKTNEAFKALQHEIANSEAEVERAGDGELEVMMAAEEVERRVKIAESRLKEAEQTVSAERKEIQALGAEKKKQLDAATAEREKIIAPVPEDLRELYTRIAKRHNGTAMAEARDGQCRGCGMRVLPHILQELRSGTNEEAFRGEIVGKLKKYIGRMTNNVAEYYGLIAAMDYAQSHAIRALRIESDSELLVKQMRGQYKVKSEDLRPLFERAQKMSKTFDSFRIEHVYREQNREADALANEALDETENKAAGAATAKKTAATTAKTEPLSSKPEPASSKTEPRKIQARFRGGVLYLLEDVELPDGMVVDVSIHLRPKPPA